MNSTAPPHSVTATSPCCRHFCRDCSSASPQQVWHVDCKVLFPRPMNVFYLDIGKMMSILRPQLLLRDSFYITIHTGYMWTLPANQLLSQALFLLVRDASMPPSPTSPLQMRKINISAESICSSITWDLLQELLYQLMACAKSCPLITFLMEALSPPQTSS